MRGLEGPTEMFLLAGGVGFLIGAYTCGPLGPMAGQDEAPMDQGNHACEMAWLDANDGDPGTEPGGIVTEPWCVQHNAAKRADQVQEDAPPTTGMTP